MAVTEYNIADMFRQKKKPDDALKLYFESERILKNLGDKFNLVNIYYILA
ncbi:MAG: hypothetical protein HXS48_17780 [Theionarchaea archaeon]|nr:hypothetical protein [Theionarchaea archaeon]